MKSPFIEIILKAYLNLISFRLRTGSDRIHSMSFLSTAHNLFFVREMSSPLTKKRARTPHICISLMKESAAFDSLPDVLERLNSGTNIEKIKKIRKTSELAN